MPDSGLADDSVLTSTFFDTYVREQVVTTCTSGTRPTGVEGRLIYETDTDIIRVYTGSNWSRLGVASVGEYIQRGILSDTTGANGLLPSMNFPSVFASTPAVVAVVVTTATTQQDTVQINAVNATAVQFRLMRNGSNAGTGIACVVHWIAIG